MKIKIYVGSTSRPVLIDIPHFASVEGKEREIIILRSENGENWKEHDNSSDNDDTLLNTTYGKMPSIKLSKNLHTQFHNFVLRVSFQICKWAQHTQEG